MKPLKYYSLKNFLLLTLFLIFTILSSNAQNRGSYSFAAPKAKFIMVSPAGKGYSGSFAGGVGGISFEKTAILENGLLIKNLDISYNNSLSDGNRLELIINQNPIQIELFDWQLIPIAKYANSNHTACFTYFGQLEDKMLEETILKYDGHILNYHPDFSNTLLGWRLADMDMLLIYNFTTDLPKTNKEYILGAGESIPDTILNNNSAYYYSQYLNSIINELGYSYQSYIISDFSRDIKMSLKNDSLKLSGFPYYYCWRLRKDLLGFDRKAVMDSVKNNYQNILNQQKLNNNDFDEQGLYIDSLVSLSIQYKQSYPIWKSGLFIDLVNLDSIREKRSLINNYTPSSLLGFLLNISTEMYAFEAVLLKEFSDKMSARPEMIEACNPAVWNATVNTMRYSAFFRYIKTNFPLEWNKFYNQISKLKPLPEVVTPTVIYDNGNKTIENALRVSLQK